jgi:transketolase
MTSTAQHADNIRRAVVAMCSGPDGGHLGGSLSLVDILSCLYFDVLHIDPRKPAEAERDILLLSKGHGAIALYATLAERGYFPAAELGEYCRSGGRLMSHPVATVPGVELPTGSLGHGLALGLGFALAARLFGPPRRVFVVLGDGELQEGSCWEAAAVAAAHGADQLTAVIDRNGLQRGGSTESIVTIEPLAERWRSFGWSVREVDGHDQTALSAQLRAAPWAPGRPSVLIAHTDKGHGVPQLSGLTQSHYVVLSARQQARVRSSLESFLSQDGGSR